MGDTIRIPFDDVASSMIGGIGYDAEKRILAVRFKEGKIKHYAGVPPDLFQELAAAGSIGQFFNSYIARRFESAPMTGDCPKCGAHGWIGDPCEDCGCAPYAAPPAPVRHYVFSDEPTATSKRLQRAACRKMVAPKEVAYQDDAITCPGCRAAYDAFQAGEV